MATVLLMDDLALNSITFLASRYPKSHTALPTPAVELRNPQHASAQRRSQCDLSQGVASHAL